MATSLHSFFVNWFILGICDRAPPLCVTGNTSCLTKLVLIIVKATELSVKQISWRTRSNSRHTGAKILQIGVRECGSMAGGARKSLRPNQVEACERLGLRKQMIQYHENGKRDAMNVKIPKFVRFACFTVQEGISD